MVSGVFHLDTPQVCASSTSVLSIWLTYLSHSVLVWTPVSSLLPLLQVCSWHTIPPSQTCHTRSTYRLGRLPRFRSPQRSLISIFKRSRRSIGSDFRTFSRSTTQPGRSSTCLPPCTSTYTDLYSDIHHIYALLAVLSSWVRYDLRHFDRCCKRILRLQVLPFTYQPGRRLVVGRKKQRSCLGDWCRHTWVCRHRRLVESESRHASSSAFG